MHPRHDAAGRGRHRRRPPAARDPPALRPVPLRAGRLQGRLGPRRARPVDRRGAASGGHGPPRRARSRRSSARSARSRPAGHADRPFTLFAQYDPWDPTRAPAGKDDGVGLLPRAARLDVDMTDRIEAQVERFAPGFPRPRPRARRPTRRRTWSATTRTTSAATSTPASRISASSLFRPTRALDPYHAGDRVYLCSASTPPGGGVHGMGGHLAARSALRRDLR